MKRTPADIAKRFKNDDVLDYLRKVNRHRKTMTNVPMFRSNTLLLAE